MGSLLCFRLAFQQTNCAMTYTQRPRLSAPTSHGKKSSVMCIQIKCGEMAWHRKVVVWSDRKTVALSDRQRLMSQEVSAYMATPEKRLSRRCVRFSRSAQAREVIVDWAPLSTKALRGSPFTCTVANPTGLNRPFSAWMACGPDTRGIITIF